MVWPRRIWTGKRSGAPSSSTSPSLSLCRPPSLSVSLPVSLPPNLSPSLPLCLPPSLCLEPGRPGIQAVCACGFVQLQCPAAPRRRGASAPLTASRRYAACQSTPRAEPKERARSIGRRRYVRVLGGQHPVRAVTGRDVRYESSPTGAVVARAIKTPVAETDTS